ncbi:3-oxoacyl-ACP reductase [Kordiimonas sediminis]|uniref:3-oxoacyl-ACP reductase n=1 Tax=Kordiimonas sediminis TaxID=1735581 RepID=A0A919AWR5_9PROT|nr:SDR family NAD(P)-dependent oxidoreductase [Kordiimonas sediminis]GHF26792.1 3-oxoacyl-ACP reductase [Kordiimonas sediminis]
MTIRFDDRVAIVTGAGNGLGREHALALAKRGAKVVVNDLGGDVSGAGGSATAAEAVVAEIVAAGGEAIANGANVCKVDEVEAMVQAAMDKWGRIDILVNNAGILRDKTFTKMEHSNFNMVVDVHLTGSMNCTKAVWDIMRDQGFGRIVMTTSSSGLYGNFGQANYGSAKMGVVGLMNTLCLEGAKYNINVNCLSPCAATRMTEGLMPQEALDLLKPELVTPAVLYLVSDEGPNRTILAAGAGHFARAVVNETEGLAFAEGEATAENIAANWDAIANSEQKELKAGGEQTMKFLQHAAAANGVKLG